MPASKAIGASISMMSQRSRANFRVSRVLFLSVAALALSDCGKKAATSSDATKSSVQGDGNQSTRDAPASVMNKPGTPGYIPPRESQEFVVNGRVDLPALTAALRDYCRWKMRVPADLNELVASRYLTNLPAPPRGQK